MDLHHYKQQIIFYRDILEHYVRYGRKYKNHQHDIFANEMIPKTIHYCWFGRGEMNDLLKRCIESWHEILPEYKFVLWNEDNFPFEEYPFAKQALKDKKWAFISDVARLHVLYYHGGIYMDTDVEVLKPLDKFLQHEFFSGFESKIHIPTGIMGAKKGNGYIYMLLGWYIQKALGRVYYQTANTRIITKLTCLYSDLKRNGCFQQFDDFVYYPRDYFCPEKMDDGWNVTDNTYAIHHFTGAW